MKEIIALITFEARNLSRKSFRKQQGLRGNGCEKSARELQSSLRPRTTKVNLHLYHITFFGVLDLEAHAFYFFLFYKAQNIHVCRNPIYTLGCFLTKKMLSWGHTTQKAEIKAEKGSGEPFLLVLTFFTNT